MEKVLILYIPMVETPVPGPASQIKGTRPKTAPDHFPPTHSRTLLPSPCRVFLITRHRGLLP